MVFMGAYVHRKIHCTLQYEVVIESKLNRLTKKVKSENLIKLIIYEIHSHATFQYSVKIIRFILCALCTPASSDQSLNAIVSSPFLFRAGALLPFPLLKGHQSLL